jgi:hypothetical protein
MRNGQKPDGRPSGMFQVADLSGEQGSVEDNPGNDVFKQQNLPENVETRI